MGHAMLEAAASLLRENASDGRAAIRFDSGYQDRRRAEGAANGTINRELAVLSCAFTLGYETHPASCRKNFTLNE